MGWIDKFYENSWLRIMRHNSTTGYTEVNGTALSPTYSVADWTALQALSMTSADDNLIALVETIGNNSNGTLFRYKHSITRWVNLHPFELFYENYAASDNGIAIPTGVTAATLFAPAATPTIPAGLLRASSKIEINAQIARYSGVNANCTCIMYLGTAGSAADSDVSAVVIALTGSTHAIGMNPIINFITTTTLITTYDQSIGRDVSTTAFTKDKNTNINTAADMYVKVGMSAKNTNDAFKLTSLSVRIVRI